MAAPSVLTRIGAGLLAALGVARGIGGLVLARSGSAAVDSARVSHDTARLLGAGLLLVAVLAVIAALRLWRGRPGAFALAVVSLIVFVLDGLLNGTLLFGRPMAGGTGGNLLAAVGIGLVLGFGARGDTSARSGGTR
jgi:hypothetical protein